MRLKRFELNWIDAFEFTWCKQNYIYSVYFSKATSHDLGDCNLVSAMGSIKQIAASKAVTFFFKLLSLNFWNLARNMSIYHYLLCCCTVCSIVQRSKLKLKLCMHDNNRTATFEKELNHNQESYLLFHRCASTKTSLLPRLLQIEIWPPLCPQWKPKPLWSSIHLF